MTEVEDLRGAFRHSFSGDASEHLSEDLWEALALGELGPGDRDNAIDHILECPECADVHRALLVVRSGAAAFDPDAPAVVEPSHGGPSTKSRWWGGLSVFALAATIVLAVVLPLRTPTEAPTGPGPMVLRSSGESSPIRPLSPVDEVVGWQTIGELVLRWEAEDELGPFVAEILDADGELIWSSPQTMDAEVLWPAELTDQPGRYYWRVLAVDSANGSIASDLASFDLVNE